jgi:hypothetical protein
MSRSARSCSASRSAIPTRLTISSSWPPSAKRPPASSSPPALERTRAREFEAFHRFTSFVVHDLKSSIATLSTLSENALKSFDDRDVQRDALNTVAQTVNRMKSMLGHLQDGAGTTVSLRLPFGGRT